MTAEQTGNAKVDPQKLELRAKPKPTTRINKKVLLAGSAIALAFLSGALLFALDRPNRNETQGRELLANSRSRTPEGIDKLPSGYDGVTQLGPPNPGDLGKPITQMERNLGIAQDQPRQLPGFRPDPEEDFRRAERIRLARLAAKANESKIFFGQPAKPSNDSGKSAAANTGKPIDPFAALNALHAASGDIANSNGTTDPNGQQTKLDFLNNKPDATIYNAHSVQQPQSQYQLMAGTIIAASLLTGLNSDLPGTVIAQVSEQTYDTLTGQHLLIPQGSRLIGKYDSKVTYGQDRALVVWQRIIRPDGSSITIDNLPGTDEAGFAGITDRVDHHTWELVKGIGFATLLGVGTELTFGSNESDLVQAIRESAQENANQAGQRLVQKSLDIQPTITVRPGWPIRIIVTKDIVLPPMATKPQ